MESKKNDGFDPGELRDHQTEMGKLNEELRLVRQELSDISLPGDQRFRMLLEKIPNIAVQAYGADGTVQYWNKASERIYGYSEKEAVGKTLYDLIIPEEAQPFVRETVWAAVSSGVDIPAGELMLRHKDGSYVAVYSSHVVIRVPGEESQLFCIDIDITDRKQAEGALADSETLQKSVLRAAPIGIGLIRHRVMQSANEKLCIMTGYAETELVGQSSRVLYPSQEEYEFVGVEKYRQIAAFGTGTVETKWLKKDGSIIDVMLSSTPLDIADLDRGVTFTALDITARKLAENALSESEERYRVVIEQAPEAVCICNPDTGEILETNSRFTSLFGYNLRRDGPMSVFDLAADRHENIAEYLTKAKLDGFLPLQRRVVRHKNGTVVQVERAATLVRYRDRSLLVQTMRDVTEDVRREQELRRDAELATRVQTALLKRAETTVHLDIATIYEPGSYVGGDLYFMDWRYGGNMLRGFLIDAAGHGLATALHTSAMHVLLREINDLDLPLPEQMRWLNQRAGQYFDEATFAGAVGFELDLQLRKLRWCCAGIPLVWLSTRDQQGIVNCSGMYLGICSAETFEMHTIPIAAGDSVCFMTDGLSEIVGLHSEMQQVGYTDMVSLLKKISLSGECRDDATVVCIQVKSLPDSTARADGWPRILRFNGYGDYQRLKGELGKILEELTGKEHSVQEVSVHEALANAMECRDGLPRQHKAQLRFNKIGNRLIVRVKTSRIGFAGNAILRRLRSHPEDMFSFGEDASMGRGMPIMLSLSDKMTYNSEGTEVLLAWRTD